MIHSTIIANAAKTLIHEFQNRLTNSKNQVFYFQELSIPRGESFSCSECVMPLNKIKFILLSNPFTEIDEKKLTDAGYTKEETIKCRESIEKLSNHRLAQSLAMKDQLSLEEWTFRFSEPDFWPICSYTKEASTYIYQKESFFGLYVESLEKTVDALTLTTYLTCCAKMIARCIQVDEKSNIYFNLKKEETEEGEIYHIMIMIN